MERILARYNEARSKSDSFSGLAKKSLALAEERDLAWNYVTAGILSLSDGDIGAALTALKKGAEVDPCADAPYHFQVRAYYQLAFFDAFDRGNCQIDLVELSSIAPDELRCGALSVEIGELLGDGRPAAYGTALEAAGFTEIHRLQAQLHLRQARSHRLTPDQQQDLLEAASDLEPDLGSAAVLPVPTWSADDQTREILLLAHEQMLRSYTCKRMPVPRGVMPGAEDIISALALKIVELLGD